MGSGGHQARTDWLALRVDRAQWAAVLLTYGIADDHVAHHLFEAFQCHPPAPCDDYRSSGLYFADFIRRVRLPRVSLSLRVPAIGIVRLRNKTNGPDRGHPFSGFRTTPSHWSESLPQHPKTGSSLLPPQLLHYCYGIYGSDMIEIVCFCTCHDLNQRR